MKFNKRRQDFLNADNTKKGILTRKEARKAQRKQKKITTALNYAKSKNTNKVCISSSDIKHLNVLKSTNKHLLSSFNNIIFSNDKNKSPGIDVRKTKKGKRKRNKNRQPKCPDDDDVASSFKTSSSSNARMAQLQEYVNQNSGKQNTSSKPKNSDVKVSGKYINDENSPELTEEQKRDEIEINQLARKLQLNAHQKSNVHFVFRDDFEEILDDINEGALSDINKYKNDPYCNYDSDDNFENDFATSFGKNVPLDDSSIIDDESVKSEGNREADSDSDGSVKSEENSEAESDENSEDEEPYVKEDNFLDDEAEETSECSDDDDEEPFDNVEEIMFESGSALRTKSSVDKPTINSIFDHYSASDSEEDESDLEGFIVDDNFVEYESELDSSMESKNRKSRIVGREVRGLSSDFVIEKSPSHSPNLKKKVTPKRRRISSGESDIEIISEPLAKKVREDTEHGLTSKVKINTPHLQSNGVQELTKTSKLENITKFKESKRTRKQREAEMKVEKLNGQQNNGTSPAAHSDSECIIDDGTDCLSPSNIKKDKDFATKSTIKMKGSNKGTNKLGNGDVTDCNLKKKSVKFSLPESEDKVDDSQLGKDYHEDIYGRLRDKKTGEVITSDNPKVEMDGKYITPGMRKLMALNNNPKKKEQLALLKRNLKGLLNRLTDSNMAEILSQIQDLFRSKGRNDMQDTLTNLLIETIVRPNLHPERFIQEHAFLIAILSANVGYEVGAYILTEFVVKWIDDLEAYEPTESVEELDTKELDNMLLFISHLYNFRVMDSTLIYDLLHKLLSRELKSKEVELVLLVLKNIGFNLRKDDPSALKNLITQINLKANVCSTHQKEKTFTRVKFMLEILTAIKNNNLSKVPNYDATHSQHLKTLMKGMIRRGCRVSELKVSLQDLLKSKAGSSWPGAEELKEDPSSERALQPVLKDEFSDEFRIKAERLHMARPPRINILYALTDGCGSYLEAFKNLMDLKLPGNQEHEIFNILIYCCVRRKEYNPLYGDLALKLCIGNKKRTRLLQFAIRDKFKELGVMKPIWRSNLAKLLAYLVGERCLNLFILNSFNFLETDATLVSFLRQTFMNLLLHPTGRPAVVRAFKHLCSTPKMKMLRQCIRLFILKFINPKKCQSEERKTLESRVEMVLDILALGGGDGTF